MSYIDVFQDYLIEVRRKPDKLFIDVSDFLLNNWLFIFFVYCYYRLSANFLGQALLLLQDGPGGVPQFYTWIFALTDLTIDILSFWLPILFTLVVFSGIYYLQIGRFNPEESDRNSQYLSLVAITPFVLYFILQLVYLNHTDKSWYFGLEFMDEGAGFQITE